MTVDGTWKPEDGDRDRRPREPGTAHAWRAMKGLFGFVPRLHRWLGSGLFLFMLTWCGSGIVMLFARFPHVPEAERLAHLSPLHRQDLPSPAALSQLPLAEQPDHGANIRMRRDRLGAHFLFAARAGTPARIEAPPGKRLQLVHSIEQRDLHALVTPYFRDEGPIAESTRVMGDRWTMRPFYGRHYPLLRVTSEAGDDVYLCESTGEVLQRTTPTTRLLAWLGAIPHWWYLRALREHPPLWEGAVSVAAGCLLVLCLSGLWGGLRQLARSQRLSWHAVLGLGFGGVASVWALSGALSVNPLGLLPGPWSTGSLDQCLQGSELSVDAYSRHPSDALSACRPLLGHVREIELTQLGGKPYYLCKNEFASTAVTPADRPGAPATRHFTSAQLRTALACEDPAVKVDIETLALTSKPDEFHHARLDGSKLQVPYGRVEMAGSPGGRVYLDVHRGRALAIYDAAGIRHHFLFTKLHTWDYAWLRRHPQLRRALMLVALAGGTLLGLSGTRAALGRAVGMSRRRRRKARDAAPRA